MTVANQTNRIAAVGNAAIGQEVPFSFPYAATSDIKVYSRVTATGVEALLTETTNYTLTAPSDIGGTLTTVTAVAATSEIHIIRDTSKTQSLDLEPGGSFNAENIEDALDKNTKLVIENKDAIGKAITFPPTDAAGLTTELPSSVERASKYLTFDASGNATATTEVPAGSVSFTTFGTNMAEAANALAGKAVINLDHVIDPRDYGIVGDGDGSGGGTDDATALQNAITAAADGVLEIPSGTYRIDSALTSTSKITIRGLGKVTLDFANIAGATIALKIYGTAGTRLEEKVVIEDIILLGPETDAHTGTPTTTTKGLHFEYLLGLRLVNVEVKGFHTGCYIIESWPISDTDCKFWGNYHGLFLDDDCTFGTHNSRYLSNYYPLYLYKGVTNQSFINCDFENAGDHAVVADPDGENQIGMQFINPYFENISGSIMVLGLTLAEAATTGNCFGWLLSGGVWDTTPGDKILECGQAGGATVYGFTILNIHGINALADISGLLKNTLFIPANRTLPDKMYYFNDDGVATQVLTTGGNPFDADAVVDGDATPSVKGMKYFLAKNDDTDITDFDDGVTGQEIILVAWGAGNTTVKHDATKINLVGGADWVGAPASRDTLHLIYDGTDWNELSRSNNA